MINIGISMINLGISMINIGISMINFGISMISILMIDMSKNLAGWILAGWISSWVENDLGGFRLGGKWLKVWVDSGGWKTARWILDGWISSTRVCRWESKKVETKIISQEILEKRQKV